MPNLKNFNVTMNTIIKILYTILPNSIITIIGKNNTLKNFRDGILRPNKREMIVSEEIVWGNGKFQFLAPIKMAVKAKNKGIESKLLRNSIKLIQDYKIENPVVLDIGANYGFISLALKTNLNATTIIHSFEPHPEIYKTFQKSISENKMDNIILKNVAIGSEDCNVELNLFGKSSNILNSTKKSIAKITIKQINLDTYLLENNVQPNYIKIDVDGYELNVLKGLKQTITKFKPIMVIETNDDYEVLDFLKGCNYKLLDLDLNEFEGMPNNVFCVS